MLNEYLRIAKPLESCMAEFDWGDHPLHYFARFNEHKDLEKCFDLYGNINVVNNFGQTPLIAAAHSLYIEEYPYRADNGFLQTFDFLLSNSADLNARDIKGWTAAQYVLCNFSGIYSGNGKDLFVGRIAQDNAFDQKKEIIKLFCRTDNGAIKAIIASDLIQQALKTQAAHYSGFLKSL